MLKFLLRALIFCTLIHLLVQVLESELRISGYFDELLAIRVIEADVYVQLRTEDGELLHLLDDDLASLLFEGTFLGRVKLFHCDVFEYHL